MNTMLDFQIPQITAEDVDDHRGVFTVEPLDRGFGYTFGNSLRRVLLSSLEGCAVTSVKIEGVQHEFTTIPGVREDVTDIILNLKGLSCRLHGEAPEIEADISKDGPGVVTAGRHRRVGRPRDPQPGARASATCPTVRASR
jgi:DNA-directed RNA polymerase subunit alpha